MKSEPVFPNHLQTQWLVQANPWWNLERSSEEIIPNSNRLMGDKLFQQLDKLKPASGFLVHGPRFVGKSTLFQQYIYSKIAEGKLANRFLYIDTKSYFISGSSLLQVLEFAFNYLELESESNVTIVLDHLEYSPNWLDIIPELFKRYKNVIWILGTSFFSKEIEETIKKKRIGSFFLPPLTFHEFLDFHSLEKESFKRFKDLPKEYIGEPAELFAKAKIETLNKHLFNYLNRGTFPFKQGLVGEQGWQQDVISKTLESDLPTLYGISETRSLQAFFTTLAYICGHETSIDELAKTFHIAKNTVRKYLTYLEAAHFIRLIERVDMEANKLERATFFKVYLVNPSYRSLLFGEFTEENLEVGPILEALVFAQVQHRRLNPLYYSSWPRGSVDMVRLNGQGNADFALEIKWGNKFAEKPNLLRNLRAFCKKNNLTEAFITTSTIRKHRKKLGFTYKFVPAALFTYLLGRNIIFSKMKFTETVKVPRN